MSNYPIYTWSTGDVAELNDEHKKEICAQWSQVTGLDPAQYVYPESNFVLCYTRTSKTNEVLAWALLSGKEIILAGGSTSFFKGCLKLYLVDKGYVLALSDE